MSVRRRAVKTRVERERTRTANYAATTAALEQLKRDLPAIILEAKLSAQRKYHKCLRCGAGAEWLE